MNSVVKMLIGLLVAILGVYWYVVGSIFGWRPAGLTPAQTLGIVFVGTFGAFLVMFGLLVAWIEYEDIKWEMKEKQMAKEAAAKKRKKRKKKRK